MHPLQASCVSPQAEAPVTARSWVVFGLTFGLMLLDFVDRQIVTSMFPYLKAEWQLSDKQLGGLVSVVALMVALCTIPVAVLADRWGRVRTIVAMALTWSSATVACGFAGSYASLLTARGAIGLGEAGYGPAGAAILGGIFPRRLHSAVFGAFQSAGALGGILGVALGGWLAAQYGWKSAFGIVGIPGIVLALCYLWVRDPSQASLANKERGEPFFWQALKQGLALFGQPLVRWTCIGGALQLFTVLAVYSWLPSFLNRSYGLEPQQAGLRAGLVILAGAAGMVAWGWAADRLSGGDGRQRLRVVAAGAALSGALLIAAFGGMSAGPAQWAMLLAGGFCMTCSIGAVPAVVMERAKPGIRATALALVAMAQNLFGQALGPFSTGVLSDLLGLGDALALAAFAAVLAALAFLRAGKAYRREAAGSAALVHNQEMQEPA